MLKLRFIFVICFANVLAISAFAEPCKLPMTTAMSSWADRVTCKDQNLSPCTRPAKDKANLPLQFHHGKKTEYVMVLFHGLSDSPYFLKDVAAIAYNAGMNVVVPRLTGMGSCPEHLGRDHTKLEDWIGTDEKEGDLQFALNQAKALGKKIIIGGFSLGGTIAIYGALKYEGMPQYPIAGLVLFSPAVKLSSKISLAIRIETAVARFLRIEAPYHSRKNFGEGVRYQKISADSVHDVMYLIKKNEQLERRISIPVFNAITTTDSRLDLKSVIDFSNLHGSTSTILMYATPKTAEKYKVLVDKKVIINQKELAHSSILLEEAQWSPPEVNPFFSTLRANFSEFLSANFK